MEIPLAAFVSHDFSPELSRRPRRESHLRTPVRLLAVGQETFGLLQFLRLLGGDLLRLQ